MSPQEIADLQLGELIHTIGGITWNNLMSFQEAMELFQVIGPMLDYQQKDAFQIVLDLMLEEEREDLAS